MASTSSNLSGLTVKQLKSALKKAETAYRAAPENSAKRTEIGYYIQQVQSTIEAKTAAQTPVAPASDPTPAASTVNYTLSKVPSNFETELRYIPPTDSLADKVLDSTSVETKEVILNNTIKYLNNEIDVISLAARLSNAAVLNTDIIRTLPQDAATAILAAREKGIKEIRILEEQAETNRIANITSGASGEDVLRVSSGAGTTSGQPAPTAPSRTESTGAPVIPDLGTEVVDYNAPEERVGLGINLGKPTEITELHPGKANIVVGHEGEGIPAEAGVGVLNVLPRLPSVVSAGFDYSLVSVTTSPTLALQPSTELTVKVEGPLLNNPQNDPATQRVVEQKAPTPVTPPVTDQSKVEPLKLQMATTLSGDPTPIAETKVTPVPVTTVPTEVPSPAHTEVTTATGSTQVMTKAEIISAAGRGTLTPTQAEAALRELRDKATSQAKVEAPAVANVPIPLDATGVASNPPTAVVPLTNGETVTVTPTQLAAASASGQVTARVAHEANTTLEAEQAHATQPLAQPANVPSIAVAAASPAPVRSENTTPQDVQSLPAVKINADDKTYEVTTPAHITELLKQGEITNAQAKAAQQVLDKHDATLVIAQRSTVDPMPSDVPPIAVTASPAPVLPNDTKPQDVQLPPTALVTLRDGTKVEMTEQQLKVAAAANQVTATEMSNANIELAVKEILEKQKADRAHATQPLAQPANVPSIAVAAASPAPVRSENTTPQDVQPPPAVNITVDNNTYEVTTEAQITKLQQQGKINEVQARDAQQVLVKKEVDQVQLAFERMQSNEPSVAMAAESPAPVPPSDIKPQSVQPPPAVKINADDNTYEVTTQAHITELLKRGEITNAQAKAAKEVLDKQEATLVFERRSTVEPMPANTVVSAPDRVPGSDAEATAAPAGVTVQLINDYATDPAGGVVGGGVTIQVSSPRELENLKRANVVTAKQAEVIEQALDKQAAGEVQSTPLSLLTVHESTHSVATASNTTVSLDGLKPETVKGVTVEIAGDQGQVAIVTSHEALARLRSDERITVAAYTEATDELTRQTVALNEASSAAATTPSVAIASSQPTLLAQDGTPTQVVVGATVTLADGKTTTVTSGAQLTELVKSEQVTTVAAGEAATILNKQNAQQVNLRGASTVPSGSAEPVQATALTTLTADGTVANVNVTPHTVVTTSGGNVQVTSNADVITLSNNGAITPTVAAAAHANIAAQTNQQQAAAQAAERVATDGTSSAVQVTALTTLTADGTASTATPTVTVVTANGGSVQVNDLGQVIALRNTDAITSEEAAKAKESLEVAGAGVTIYPLSADPITVTQLATDVNTSYKIESGDTLSKIAADNRVTVQQLMELNPQIKDANLIYAGSTITLPTSSTTVTVTAHSLTPAANATPAANSTAVLTVPAPVAPAPPPPYAEPDEPGNSVAATVAASNYDRGVASTIVQVGDTERALTREEVIESAGKGQITPDQADAALTTIRKQQESINTAANISASYNELKDDLASHEAYLEDSDKIHKGFKDNYKKAQADVNNAYAAGDAKTLVDFGDGRVEALTKDELLFAAGSGQISQAALAEGRIDLKGKSEAIMERTNENALQKADNQVTGVATSTAQNAENFANGIPSVTVQTTNGSVATYKSEDEVWEAVSNGSIAPTTADTVINDINIQKGAIKAQDTVHFAALDSSAKAERIATQMDTLSIPNVTITDKHGYTRTYSEADIKDAVSTGQISKETAKTAQQDLSRQRAVLDGAGTTTLTLNDGTVINNATKEDVVQAAGKGQITPDQAGTALNSIRANREEVAKKRVETEFTAADELNSSSNKAQGKQAELYAKGVPTATVLDKDGNMHTLTEDQVWEKVEKGELSTAAASDAMQAIDNKKAQLKADEDAAFASLDQTLDANNRQDRLYNHGVGTATVTDKNGNSRTMTAAEVNEAVQRGDISPETAKAAMGVINAKNDSIQAVQAARNKITRNKIADQRKRNNTAAQPGDWRVRIKLAPNAGYLYKDLTPISVLGQTERTSILAPLASTDGVVFPYTPTVSLSYTANYNSYDLTHSNYRGYFYQNSFVGAVSINADFTAQDTEEAQYLLAVIHFFKSCTKMFYGQDTQRGSPPPLVYLSGFGAFQFNEHSAVVQDFTYSLPNDVDYIRAYEGANSSSNVYGPGVPNNASAEQLRLLQSNLRAGAMLPGVTEITSTNLAVDATYVPTKISLSITLLPVQTRLDQTTRFSLKDYASGALLKGGFW